MRFLGISVIRADRISEIPSYYDDEAQRVWELIDAGQIREIYFSRARSTAYVVLDAPDDLAIRAALATLPLVKSGILDWDIVALEPLPELAALLARRAIAPPPWWPLS